ncbi:MAG TPA: sodium/proline symporter PutP [Gammaproteobacteria bacterium]|nr:sodium/proline symporter PutP [Gammaproteobacteria bacterium]
MIENNPYIAGTFAVYLGVILLLAWIAYRRTRNLSDFILGGRSLNSWFTAMAAQASDMSGWLLMGLPGFAYLAGMEAGWMVAGLLAGTYFNWKVVARRLREATEKLGDALTMPDYLERRFADDTRVLRLIAGAFVLFFFTLYTSSGFVAGAKLFESLFGVPYGWALILGGLSIVLYTFFGGFLAISWADFLQGTLMFFALILVAAAGWHAIGGGDGLHASLNALNAELLDPFTAGSGEALGWIGIASLLAWGLGYPGQPHILTRFMAIRDPAELKTSRRIAMAWQASVLAAAMVVGLTAVGVLEVPLQGADAEKAFILMAAQFFPAVIAGVCLSAILAAIMSTASAQLLVASSAFAEDFYKGLARRDAGQKELLWVGRAAVLGISLLGLWMARNPDSKVLDLVAWAWAGFGATFGPAVILSLYWPRMTRNAALAGMLVGGITAVAWPLARGSAPIFDLYELLPGFVLSMLAIVVVTLLRRK